MDRSTTVRFSVLPPVIGRSTPRLILFIDDDIVTLVDAYRSNLWHHRSCRTSRTRVNPGTEPKGARIMTNRIGKLLRAIVPAPVNGEVTRQADLAREQAWHDAYLRSSNSD